MAGGTVSLAFAWGGAELGTLCVWMLSLTSNGEAFMPSGAGIAFTPRGVFRGVLGVLEHPSSPVLVYLGVQDQLLACSMAVLAQYFLIQLVLATC